jgi:hypothetical protein
VAQAESAEFIQFVKHRQAHCVRVSLGRQSHIAMPHQFHRHARRNARPRQHRCERVPQRMEKIKSFPREMKQNQIEFVLICAIRV